jgi:ferredoxin
MAKKYKVNKQKCIGCGICVQSCPEAMKLGDDMKAKIIDHEKLEHCGGVKVCPFGAIEEVKEKLKIKN